jgi:hypothetical protein
MVSLSTLNTRLINSPAMRRADKNYFPMYRTWRAWAMRRVDGPTYFQGVQAFAADVAKGYNDVRNKWRSAR